MRMSPSLRKFVLTTHVTFTVGWLGAVVVFLASAVLGVTSQNAQIVRGAYLVMEPTAWSVLVPLAFASLLTGIIQSLGTPWGFFRYYWVVYKLVLTAAATTILLIYMGTFREMAAVAADPDVGIADQRNPSPVLHSVLAIFVLLVATVLAIYKPFGMTRYGQRKLLEQRADEPSTAAPQTGAPALGRGIAAARWTGYVLVAIIAAILIVLALHLAGGGMHGH